VSSTPLSSPPLSPLPLRAPRPLPSSPPSPRPDVRAATFASAKFLTPIIAHESPSSSGCRPQKWTCPTAGLSLRVVQFSGGRSGGGAGYKLEPAVGIEPTTC